MHLRRLLPAVLVVVPGLLALPVVTPPAAAARPVAPVVVELPLTGVAAPAGTALRAAGSARTVVLTEQRATRPFEVVGLTWDAVPTGEVTAQVRTRSGGRWSAWTPLEVEPEQPTEPGARPGTSPAWVGEADGVQARVDVVSGAAPTGVRLSLVDPGESPADATAATPVRPASTAHAAGWAPEVRPRSAWGADESIRGGSPSYASRLRAVTLHHTASSSSYDRDDVPRLLRGFYAYHVKSNGWSDIGYNFLVDRFGTVWEGRAGGTTRNVIGAHAGGFNTGTAGVSMIGTYESTVPSSAMLEGVAQVAGWKMGLNGIDPRGSVTLTSAGSTRYRSGTAVSLRTLFAHRDVSTTSCPGTQGMAALPRLRERAAALAAGATPLPAEVEASVPDDALRVSAPSTAASGSTVDVVVNGVPGRPVQLWFATSPTSGATLRREAAFDETGLYRTSFTAESDQTLFAVSDGVTSPRVTTTVTPTAQALGGSPSPLGISGPVTVDAGSPALVTVTGPAGTGISVWFRPHDEEGFTRRRTGRIGDDGTWTTTYVSDTPHDYFAMSSTVTSPDATTLVGPVPNGLHVAAPSSAPGGTTVPLVVQGTPGSAVEMWFARTGEPFQRRREGVLAADGTYRTSWVASDEHTMFAVAGGRTSARVTTRVDGPTYVQATPPSAPRLQVAAPDGVDAGRPVELVVTGPAGAPVAVWFKERRHAVYTLRRTGRFDDTGSYRTSYVAYEDQEVFATSGSSASMDAGTPVRPVLAAPARSVIGRTVTLTGRARPGDAVVVEQRRRATGAVTRLTTTASSSGTFSVRTTTTDETDFRPLAGGRAATAWTTTRIVPTITGPGRAGRGSVVRLSGTARPGAVVEVLFRAQGVRTFAVRRTLRADSRGRFTTTFGLLVAHRWYARTEGLGSAYGLTVVR